MTTSSKVSKLPNMQFRVWRVASKKCKTGAEALRMCRDNGVPCNSVFLNKLNPKLVFVKK